MSEIQAGPAADVTVRLFSTQQVNSVALAPTAANMRLCSNCKEVPIASGFEIKSTPGGLLAGTKPARQIYLSGQIRVTSDSGQVASAAGQWKVSAARDGLHVLLTIPSERYVMAVLAREASAADSIESLKALAVTARSFALANLRRHGAEGLCDNTHCQALRFAAVPDRIEQAVRETSGERLWWRAAPVPGYFTQNSGGLTEDASNLWGGERKSWLASHSDPYSQDQPSQWHAEIDGKQLRAALESEGWRLQQPLDGIRMLERDPSGRVHRLELRAGAQRMAISAASLRFCIDRSLGWNQLRSDLYEVHFTQGKAVFDGKGYGHGVGLSQAGAAKMARDGRDYRAILKFYFPGTTVRVTVTDTGWQRFDGNGWTLRATSSSSAAVLTAGNEALRQARALWPSSNYMSATVTIYPATELFRQATGEPGWTLASTRSMQIALQPLLIVQRQSDLQKLLLHEFLHVLVEQESSGSAPLWLREGLVEALTGDATPSATMTASEIEQALHHPKNLAETARAHQAAGALVKKLWAFYGKQTVRGWLRSGPPGRIAAR
ncbi:MAG: SpoIID/LytB domain-containing protein [Acidobacteriaceae bacterium]|nr:SpoIID/LytB domain-containing protein [Acidobacteriaceae bacterium]